MRPTTPSSQAYREKATVSRVIWGVIGIFIVYSVWCVATPYVKSILFESETSKICSDKVLSQRDLDFGPIIEQLLDAAQRRGVKMQESDIEVRTQGGINHVTIHYSTKGSWLGYEWEPKFEAKYMSAQKRVGY